MAETGDKGLCIRACNIIPLLSASTNFYRQHWDSKPQNTNREYEEFMATASKDLFDDPEDVLSKLLMSEIKRIHEKKAWERDAIYKKKQELRWNIEWKVFPEYHESEKFAKIYARFAIYPEPVTEATS